MRTFEEAWSDKEKKGYEYGPDALENVKFGWEIALEELAAGNLADLVQSMFLAMSWNDRQTLKRFIKPDQIILLEKLLGGTANW